MKRILYLSLLLLLTCCPGLYARSGDEAAIRNILARQSAAWNKGDLEGFMNGYWKNDSLMFIGKKGITYGWRNTLDNYRKSYPGPAAMGKLQFTVIMIKRLSPEYRHVTGKWHLQREAGDLEGYFTLLFRKMNGHWLIVSDHSS